MRIPLFALIIALSFVILACDEPTNPSKTEPVDVKAAVKPDYLPYKNFMTDINVKNSRCFYLEKPSVKHEGEFDYYFIRLYLDSEQRVTGYIYIDPYKEDIVSGSVDGEFNQATREIKLVENIYTKEGIKEIPKTYLLSGRDLSIGVKNTDGSALVIPIIEITKYNEIFDKYQKKSLRSKINTTNRELLESNASLSSIPEHLKQSSKIFHREIDLDSNPETLEHIMMLINDEYCNSEGCRILVFDSNKKLTSTILNAKLPIYIPKYTLAEQQQNKGKWVDLYPYCFRMKQLIADENGKYNEKAIDAKTIDDSTVINFPEKFIKILDVLE